MSDIAGEWHEVNVRVDTVMTADGERPGYVFEDVRCLDCERPGDCTFLRQYWPPEFREVPGPGLFLVRYNTAAWIGDLEWQER